MLKSEIHQLENEKQDIETELHMKEQREKERILPEIERMNNLINDVTSELAQIEAQATKEEKQNQEMEDKLTEMEKKKDSYKEEIEQLQ